MLQYLFDLHLNWGKVYHFLDTLYIFLNILEDNFLAPYCGTYKHKSGHKHQIACRVFSHEATLGLALSFVRATFQSRGIKSHQVDT